MGARLPSLGSAAVLHKKIGRRACRSMHSSAPVLILTSASCMHAHAHGDTETRTHMQARTHACKHLRTHAHTRMHTYTCMHACTDVGLRADTSTRKQMHAHARTCAHTYSHSHTQTHTRTRRLPVKRRSGSSPQSCTRTVWARRPYRRWSKGCPVSELKAKGEKVGALHEGVRVASACRRMCLWTRAHVFVLLRMCL